MDMRQLTATVVISAVVVILVASSFLDMTLAYKHNHETYSLPVYQTALLTTIVAGAVYYAFRRGTKG